MDARSEREKMLSGDFYNPRDGELLEMYHTARRLILEFNQLDSRNMKQRNRVLKQILGETGSGVWVEAPFYCNYGKHIFIGEHTFVNMNCVLLDDNYIRIGKNGLIGPSVQIYTASHPLNYRERVTNINENAENLREPDSDKDEVKVNRPKYKTTTKPVMIGDNTWIGGNAVILPGVRIGNNVTVGAGSVVTKDIPDNMLALGNPCRVVRAIG